MDKDNKKVNLELDTINNIKSLTIDMMDNKKLIDSIKTIDLTNILYTLYSNHLNINENDSNWFNRDRFIMSSQFDTSILSAILFMSGYLTLDDLKNHKKIKKGIDIMPLPQGQNIATSVGMALASHKLNFEIKTKKKNFIEAEKSLVTHKIYVLCNQYDLMPGISDEALSIATNLKLNNLIILCVVDNTFEENIINKYNSIGFNTISIKNEINSIDKAITKAKNSSKPTIITINSPLTLDLRNDNNVDLERLSKNYLKGLLNLEIDNSYYVNNEALNYFKKKLYNHMSKAYFEWSDNYKLFKSGNMTENPDKYNFLINEQPSFDILKYEFYFDLNKQSSLIDINNKILKVISSQLPNLILGHTNSSLTDLSDDNISSNNLKPNNIDFKARENAMGAILNGMAFYNYRPVATTSLDNLDNMKHSVRLTPILKKSLIYIFEENEFNPNYKPVEQLESLRDIPNIVVYRPYDTNELIGCWDMILKYNIASAIVLSNKEIENIGSKENVKYGAYIIREEVKKLDGILISTGSDVKTTLNIADELTKKYNLSLRVVSMPSKELYDLQPLEYKSKILPIGVRKIFIESSTHREDYCYSIVYNKFNSNGTEKNLKEYNFDFNSLEERIVDYLKKDDIENLKN